MKRLLSIVLAMLMLISVICVAPVSVGAAQVEVAETSAPETLYLNAGVWDQASAEFRAWVWGGSTADKWIYFTDPDGDGIYEAPLGGTYTGMKVLRCAPGSTEWTSWNDSGDQVIPTDGKNMLVVNDWSSFEWDTYTPPAAAVPGDASAFYLMGTLTDWATGQNMVYAEDTGVVTITLDLDAGNYEFKIKKDSNWMGVGTLTTTINAGGTIGGTDNVTLAADGGTYTFNYTIATKALDIVYTAPEVDPTEAPATTQAPTDAPATETPTEAPVTTEAPTDAPEVSYTVNFINSNKWDSVYVYAWTDGGAGLSWPGVPMTKSEDTVNGFDVYTITFDVEYDNVIFNNNNNGLKTDDLIMTKGQYFDAKAATWYESLDDVPAVDLTSTDVYLVGSFNAWSTTANEFKLASAGDNVGYATLTLEANTSYEFKIVKSGSWTSTSTAITDTVTGVTFSASVGDNATITSKAAGEYVFAYAVDSSSLSVTYPVVTPDPTEAPATTVAPTDAPATEAPATTQAPVVPEYITIYFTNNWGWTDVRVHTWGSAFDAGSEWPGNPMDYVETNDFNQDIYTAQIPADATTVVFTGTNSSDGLDQSSNTVVKDGYGYYMEWTEELGSHAIEYEYVPSTPEVTTTSATTAAPTDAPATEAPATTAAPTDAPATEAPATTQAPVVAEYITIYFTNNWGWTDVRVHTWGSAFDAGSEWPGNPMDYVETNDFNQDIYTAQIPADATTVVFTGTNSSDGLDQSSDTVVKDGFGYYMEWTEELGSHAVEYEYVPSTPATGDEPTTDAPTDAPTTDAPQDVELITVFFQNNWYWSDVRIHIWGSSFVDYNTEWPGTEMAYYDNDGNYDYYSFNVPADAEGFQINGLKDDGTGNRDQTPDIKEGFYESICYYMMWADGNQVGSDDLNNIFAPVEPPTSGGEGGEGEDPIIPAPVLIGTSVTLGGNLGVNFWFEINDYILDDENAKVIMNVPNSGEYTEVVVPVTEGYFAEGAYGFTAEVAAKEMTSVIEVQLVATDYETIVYRYTVQDYLTEILADTENYAAEQDIVKALLNYGAASQVYFNYNTDALANDTELMTDADRVLVEGNNEAYAPVIVGEGDVIKYYGASLVLESETSLKFYFIVDETKLPEGATPAIDVNGLTCAGLEKNGNMWTLKIEDIAAHQLSEAYELAIGNGCTITYSAMSYAYQAQQSSKAALVDVANALTAYCNAAGNYITE